jgi:hypothetical protein
VDTAVGFNGLSSGDYVEIAEPADGSQAFSQPTSGTGLTVEAWIRPDLLTFPGETADKYIHWLGKCVDGSGQCEWGFRFYSQDSPSRPRSREQQRFPLRISEFQRVGHAADSGGMGTATRASLEVRDSPPAQARAFGQFLLRQPNP